MSSGGQRGIDISGITAARVQFASDATTRQQARLTFQTFASTSGANAYQNETPNATGSYLTFLQGLKESCTVCEGLPYANRAVRSFRT